MTRRIELTDAIRSRLKILQFADGLVGCDDMTISYSMWEALKLEFADEVIAEIARSAARLSKLDALPPREPIPAVYVQLRRTRRRS